MSEEETEDWFERAVGDDPDDDPDDDPAAGDRNEDDAPAEDDWFARAVGSPSSADGAASDGANGADETAADATAAAANSTSDGDTADERPRDDEPADGLDGWGIADGPDGDTAGDGNEPTGDGPVDDGLDATSSDAAGGGPTNDDATNDDATDDDATDDDTTSEGSADEAADDDGAMFEQDFASALEGAPDVAGGGEDFGMGGEDLGMGGGGGDFGMGGDLDDDFGMGGDLDDDFGMGGDDFDVGGEDFGMGGGFGGGGEDFDDAEEVESDIDRIDLGIDGLDEMVQGGVPRRSLMVAIGSAGTGKTTFGLQFLDEGLQNGDRAIFIALEESRERIINSATEKGMHFDEYAAAGDLAIVDLDPVEMANSLSSIRSELPRLIDEFGATRLVLDSVSLLEMMYDQRAARRNEIFDFTQSLKRSGVTTMMTSEASEDSPYASRHGIVEYLTDAVFILQYVRPSDFRETRLAVEIQKIRDANHSRETKPYEITNQGISVYRQANIF